MLIASCSDSTLFITGERKLILPRTRQNAALLLGSRYRNQNQPCTNSINVLAVSDSSHLSSQWPGFTVLIRALEVLIQQYKQSKNESRSQPVKAKPHLLSSPRSRGSSSLSWIPIFFISWQSTIVEFLRRQQTTEKQFGPTKPTQEERPWSLTIVGNPSQQEGRWLLFVPVASSGGYHHCCCLLVLCFMMQQTLVR